MLFFKQMVLLTVESQYVKHLACNVLVAVSEFLVDSVFYNFLDSVKCNYRWDFTGFCVSCVSSMCFLGEQLGGFYPFVVCLYEFGDHCGGVLFFIMFGGWS